MAVAPASCASSISARAPEMVLAVMDVHSRVLFLGAGMLAAATGAACCPVWAATATGLPRPRLLLLQDRPDVA